MAMTTNAATIRRKMYSLGGKPIATRATGYPAGETGKNGIFYLHNDHPSPSLGTGLGGNSVMSYGQGHGANVGKEFPNSRGRYFPYGGWRVTPTTGLTDQGYTGHKHNNLGSTADDLGLIFMNARYYLPSAGRFISADTIVPDPTNPQQFNRYTYVENQPLNYIDASGHCKGYYDPLLGTASEDQECWDYLYNDFCGGGNITAICSDWLEIVAVGQDACGGPNGCLLHFYGNYWTRSELEILSHAFARAITALNGSGYDGQRILSGVVFHRHHNTHDSWVFPRSTVNLGHVDDWTIWHELAHVISFRNSHKPQNEFYTQILRMAEAGGYTIDHYCVRAYCHRQYHIAIRWYTGRNPEIWADAFAIWMHHNSYGTYPYDRAAGWTFTVHWSGIMSAVGSSLRISSP
jgi:RHS repeat-associated protein